MPLLATLRGATHPKVLHGLVVRYRFDVACDGWGGLASAHPSLLRGGEVASRAAATAATATAAAVPRVARAANGQSSIASSGAADGGGGVEAAPLFFLGSARPSRRQQVIKW